jgi:predicted O-methyltransferase YrrM
MTDTLHDPKVRDLLDRLFADAAGDEERDAIGLTDDEARTATAAQRADAMAGHYMPISASGGNLLYALVRASRPETVVEFGTSFGISTIYLAAGVADNGGGHVYGSELSASKVTAATANLAEAGLGGHATVLAGDALETLAAAPGEIGLVLLDGWKDLYVPVLRLLEPRLRPGALVVADDSSFESVAPYLEYVRDPANGYVTVAFPVEDGMEISVRV